MNLTDKVSNLELELELTRNTLCRELNSVSSKEARSFLSQDTVARPNPGRSTWLLCIDEEHGCETWIAEFESLLDLAKTFRVRFGVFNKDIHGEFVTVFAVARD